MTFSFNNYTPILEEISKQVEKNSKVGKELDVDGVILPIWAKSFVDLIYQVTVNELSKDGKVSQGMYDVRNIGFYYNGFFYCFSDAFGCDELIIKRTEDNLPPTYFFAYTDIDWSGDNELIEYIIVNKDLEMSPGKIGAQVGHACTDCAVNECGKTLFDIWHSSGIQKKIVLGGHEKDLKKLVDKGVWYPIIDMGLTEIPANSLTCISLGVMTRKMAHPYIKRFQLFK